MGCVYSRVEEETVRRCKERKRLIKQLVICRGELAAAHLAYLQSLRNTGATLREFTDDGSFVPGSGVTFGIGLPRSPLPLPPSPPPPPFSPDSRKDDGEEEQRGGREEKENIEKLSAPDGEECIDIDYGIEICTPPPPPTWDFLDPFGPPTSSSSSSPAHHHKADTPEPEGTEEENWAETNTEFLEEEEELEGEGAEADGALLKPLIDKSPRRADLLIDDNSSAVSWFTKDTEMALVVWRSKKTLAGIVKELDDYFLKASAGGVEVMTLLESNRNNCFSQNFVTKGKGKSAKVFSSLSWKWASRSPLSSKDACKFQGPGDTCRSSNHCMTLDKLYAEEQRLYKVVKDEEIAKMHHRKKILLLQKQQASEQDWTTTEKTRAGIEELHNQIRSLQESINRTCLSISKLRDEELHSQLTDLSSGLLQMWRTMYECHQVQNHIAQQANHLRSSPSTEPTSASHLHATRQLEAEVTSWYNAFHKLLKTQREYAHILNQWVRLTDCLPDNNELPGPSSGIYALCHEWQLALDRLPDKVAAEAIKGLVSVVHSIGLQLVEEQKLQKKSEHLEKRLEKELNLLSKMESIQDENFTEDTRYSSTGQNCHTKTTKHKKLDSLKKKAEEEKAKYLNSIHVSQAMTLNNLQTSLPNVFQAMTVFAGVCMQAFESIHGRSAIATSREICRSPFLNHESRVSSPVL